MRPSAHAPVPWYEDWFDRDEYELVYAQRDEREAEQVVNLIEALTDPAPGAAILDVGCGRGRHARALAQRGYQVTGVDLSERSIEQARRRAAAEGLAIDFRVQDMREPMGDGDFDGAINLFTAFGYFDDAADHQRALQRMADALRSGGWLVQDFLNAPHVIAHLTPTDVRHEGDVRIEQRRWIEDGRINKEITLHRNGATHTFHESVRLLTLHDFKALYEVAGLQIQAVRGDYDGAAYTPHSPRLIMHAKNVSR